MRVGLGSIKGRLGANVASLGILHNVMHPGACGGEGYTSCPALQRADNPHFLDPGWALLSDAVAGAVRNATGQ